MHVDKKTMQQAGWIADFRSQATDLGSLTRRGKQEMFVDMFPVLTGLSTELFMNTAPVWLKNHASWRVPACACGYGKY